MKLGCGFTTVKKDRNTSGGGVLLGLQNSTFIFVLEIECKYTDTDTIGSSRDKPESWG